MDVSANQRSWRLRPIFRVAAWAITLLSAFASGVLVVETVKSFVAGAWRDLPLGVGLAAAGVVWWFTYGRLIAIAAWTGEEPEIDLE